MRRSRSGQLAQRLLAQPKGHRELVETCGQVTPARPERHPRRFCCQELGGRRIDVRVKKRSVTRLGARCLGELLHTIAAGCVEQRAADPRSLPGPRSARLPDLRAVDFQRVAALRGSGAARSASVPHAGFELGRSETLARIGCEGAFYQWSQALEVVAKADMFQPPFLVTKVLVTD